MTNSVTICGRFVAEPELKQLANGKNVMNFTLAVPRSADKTDFIDCVAWEAVATLIRRFADKGGRIAVTGSIETRTWKDNENKSRKETYVRVQDFTAIDFREKEKTEGEKPWKPEARREPEDVFDDDTLPF